MLQSKSIENNSLEEEEINSKTYNREYQTENEIVYFIMDIARKQRLIVSQRWGEYKKTKQNKKLFINKELEKETALVLNEYE